jgi:hypothetical protein
MITATALSVTAITAIRGAEPGVARHDLAEHEWMADAACKGRTNLFFGAAGERPERRVRREESARKVCADCPVLLPCRALARAGNESGFWGGESEEDRAAVGHAPRSISRRSVQVASQLHRGLEPTRADQAEAS